MSARSGIWFGIGAYGFWGMFPLYFLLLAKATPQEIIAHRIVWTLLFALGCALLTGQRKRLVAVFRETKVSARLAAAGVLVAANWSIYVWAITNGHLLDAALGYFVNPLVTVLLAIAFLRERLRRLQLAALLVGSSAVVVISVWYGQIPWISLLLAVTFGFYGLLKKQVSTQVTPLVGLTLETLWVAPLAAAFIVFLQSSGEGTLTSVSPTHTIALLMAGVVTATPLLFFASATRRVSLTTIALLQYICPLMQFIFGITVFNEDMPAVRWVGFALIWAALTILTIDMLRNSHAE
ncbi:MAG: EamA family transporter RarD [Propionibacteriaceae bacterium]|nr:EamA family transporter RarD [Propionibacteriaceae bacterium]